MRRLMTTLTALAMALPATFTVAATDASARTHRYEGKTQRHYQRCRHSSGTTGLIAGGAGGALAGRSILGHGALGTVAGAVGGAFAGRAIDRTISAPRRCRKDN